MIPLQAPGDWKGGSTAVAGPSLKRQTVPPPSDADFRFTVAKGALFAWGYKRPASEARIASLASGKARVEKVSLPGSGETLKFSQNTEGLVVSLPTLEASRMPYGLRIEGMLPLGDS